MELNTRVALVTGGAVGIGLAICKALAKVGYRIVVNYHSSSDAANSLVLDIEAGGGHALAVKANIANFDETKYLIDQTIAAFGRLDVVVNNAGISDDALILRMSEEQFDRVIQTDLKGVWSICKHSMKSLMASDNGRIINISSVSGLTGNVGQTNYAAAKAGVFGLTKSLAREFALRKITVNAIAPGFIETAMTKKISPVLMENILNAIPMKQIGNPDDVASIVVFLASEGARYITGQIITVDGGLSM